MFKKVLLKFIRVELKLTYNIRNTEELKLLTRMRLGLSHLTEHSF